jgi:hypothetical protein
MPVTSGADGVKEIAGHGTPVPWRAGWLVLYLVFVSVVMLACLEAFCRLGWIPNSAYRLARACDASGTGRRALILGDSFSVDFAGSYGRLLAEDLRGKGVYVANLALPGAGPLDYRERLSACAGRLEPGLVVVNYYVGNDASDTSAVLRRRLGLRDPLRRVARVSYLGALALDIRARRVQTQRLRTLERREVLNPFLEEAGRVYPEMIVDNLLLESSDMQRAWEANQEALRDMERLIEAVGGRMLLAILPATTQVSRSHSAFYADLGFRIEDRAFRDDAPQRLLRSFCRDERIECVDLLPEFRRQQPRELYLENDDHWNPDGQMLAFTVVRDRIELLGW